MHFRKIFSTPVVFAASLAIAVMPAVAANADGSPVLFGVDKAILAQAQSDTPGIKTVRVYSSGIPRYWTRVPAGLTGIYSFRPDIVETVNGSLDSRIFAALNKLPSGSWVTIWHEANNGTRNFTAAQYTAAVSHVASLISDNQIPVKFGQILGSYPVRTHNQDLTQWVVPGLGFYGMDGYNPHKASVTPAAVFGKAFAEILSVEPSASLAVIETNVLNPPNLTAVNNWAKAAWSYACNQGVVSFAIFASAKAVGHPEIPSPRTMRYLASHAASGTC